MWMSQHAQWGHSSLAQSFDSPQHSVPISRVTPQRQLTFNAPMTVAPVVWQAFPGGGRFFNPALSLEAHSRNVRALGGWANVWRANACAYAGARAGVLARKVAAAPSPAVVSGRGALARDTRVCQNASSFKRQAPAAVVSSREARSRDGAGSHDTSSFKRPAAVSSSRETRARDGAGCQGHTRSVKRRSRGESSSTASACNVKRRRLVSRFSVRARAELELLFQVTVYPSSEQLQAASVRIQEPVSRVRAWFHNRRSKLKRTAAYKHGNDDATAQSGVVAELRRQLSPAERDTLLHVYRSSPYVLSSTNVHLKLPLTHSVCLCVYEFCAATPASQNCLPCAE